MSQKYSIKVYSQNVNGDKRSEDVPSLFIKEQNMEKFTFANRVEKICEAFPKDVDVVALNEIRYEENVKLVKGLMEKRNYHVKVFANNDSDMTFHNILCVKKDSKWKPDEWCKKWLAVDVDENKPFLSDKLASMEGDPHGRCVGIVYLKHKENSNKKVCVAVSHVVPFGKAKYNQQKALFSLNDTNLENKIPTLIVGDVNRFPDEKEGFNSRLESYRLIEADQTKLVVPRGVGKSDIVFKKKEDIGTFSPWPIDRVFDEKKSLPLSESRLDAHVYTNDENLVRLKSAWVEATMFTDPDSSETPPKGFDKTRYLLHGKMASDHLALISTFEI